MASDKTVFYFGPGRTAPSPIVSRSTEENDLEVVRVDQAVELRALLHRTLPACVVMETGTGSADLVEAVRMLKEDSFTRIVPLAVMLSGGDSGVSDLLAVGADEVVHDSTEEREKRLRLDQVLKRADRDVSVHLTTRLPGTTTSRGTCRSGSIPRSNSASATRTSITSRSSTIATGTRTEMG